MEKLPLFLLIDKISTLDFLNLVTTCKTFQNKYIVKKEMFWAILLKRDFPEHYEWTLMNGGCFSEMYLKRCNFYSCGAIQIPLYVTLSEEEEIWKSTDGDCYNSMQGFVLRKDKTDPNLAYLYPRTYFRINQKVSPIISSKSRNVMKIDFKEYRREVVPRDDSVFGEVIFYRRGNGKVTWFNYDCSARITFEGYNMSGFYVEKQGFL